MVFYAKFALEFWTDPTFYDWYIAIDLADQPPYTGVAEGDYANQNGFSVSVVECQPGNYLIASVNPPPYVVEELGSTTELVSGFFVYPAGAPGDGPGPPYTRGTTGQYPYDVIIDNYVPYTGPGPHCAAG